MRIFGSRRCSATRWVDQKRSDRDGTLTAEITVSLDCDQRKRPDEAHIRCAGSSVSRATGLSGGGSPVRQLASSLAFVIVLGACGGAAAPAPTPGPPPPPSPTPSTMPVVKAGGTALGKILVDSTKGMTPYTWAKGLQQNPQGKD